MTTVAVYSSSTCGGRFLIESNNDADVRVLRGLVRIEAVEFP
jgi:hypothetical protein